MVRANRLGILSFPLGILLLANPVAAQDARVRIIQTNAAGDNVHIIDPVTNTVVDIITGIEIPHGVTSHPDGSEYYFSNEVEHTLDVFSTETLQLLARIPLTDRPNNVAITPDGTRVYVAIAGGAFVDVIDVRARQNVRSIPTDGWVHNVYVTPDGKHMVAGMIGAGSLSVFDTQTDQHIWSLEFDQGIPRGWAALAVSGRSGVADAGGLGAGRVAQLHGRLRRTPGFPSKRS